MAITSSVFAAFRPFQLGPTVDKRYPSHLWTGVTQATGDVSGGTVTASVVLETTTVLSRRVFSIEGLSPARSDALGTAWTLRLVGFENLVAGVSPIAQFGGAWRSFTARQLASGADLLAVRAFPALFAHRPGAVSLQVDLLDDLNSNGATYELDAWGFAWDQDARMLAGGPRWPDGMR